MQIQFFTHQLRHGSPDEQQVAADSLWPLTWGDQANTKMEFMVMHHVLELLADVLADGRRPFAVRHKACNIVQNLACNAKYRDRLVELGAIKSERLEHLCQSSGLAPCRGGDPPRPAHHLLARDGSTRCKAQHTHDHVLAARQSCPPASRMP